MERKFKETGQRTWTETALVPGNRKAYWENEEMTMKGNIGLIKLK